MDERSDQIIEQMESQRQQLGANLNELEDRVRRTADWRTHFDNNPLLMLAGALGGGILLGAMVSGSRSRSSRSSYTSSRHFTGSSGTGAMGRSRTSRNRPGSPACPAGTASAWRPAITTTTVTLTCS